MSVLNDCNHKDTFCDCDSTNATKPSHVGNLTLWFRLTCELEVLKSLLNKIKYWDSIDNPEDFWVNEITSGQNTLTSHNVQKSPSKLNSSVKKEEQILIIITIACLKFNTNFDVPEDTTEHIHIEYSFLSSRRLKTVRRKLSSNELNFNFTQKFKRTDHNQQRLMNMLRDTEQNIKLTLVKTKQFPDPKNDGVEIGFGLLHLGKFINEWNSPHENTPHIIQIPILSKQPPYNNIAHLDILIEDVGPLKKLS